MVLRKALRNSLRFVRASALDRRRTTRRKLCCMESTAWATIEPLERRVLLSGLSLTAWVDQNSNPTSEIKLDYTYTIGQHVELEEFGPGELNYQTVGAFTANSSGSGEYDVTGLQTNSHYSFRIKSVDSSGNVQYATGFAKTNDVNASLQAPTLVTAKMEQFRPIGMPIRRQMPE